MYKCGFYINDNILFTVASIYAISDILNCKECYYMYIVVDKIF
jgi:hypothetical protein